MMTRSSPTMPARSMREMLSVRESCRRSRHIPLDCTPRPGLIPAESTGGAQCPPDVLACCSDVRDGGREIVCRNCGARIHPPVEVTLLRCPLCGERMPEEEA